MDGEGSRYDIYAGFDDINVKGDCAGDIKSLDCEDSQSGGEFPNIKSCVVGRPTSAALGGSLAMKVLGESAVTELGVENPASSPNESSKIELGDVLVELTEPVVCFFCCTSPVFGFSGAFELEKGEYKRRKTMT
jgi:hypothetical protein